MDGYYVRVADPDSADAASPLDGFVPIKNRPPDSIRQTASQMVSPDALALVRFGLRAADDPRIRNTVRVIDALLKVDLPAGPCRRRYNGDGYGEHEDGRPSGSAMPLTWAHAEHVKLLRSLADGRVFDTPPQTRQRYQVDGVRARHCVWRFNQKCRSLSAGHILRVEVLAAATIHWSGDGWRSVRDSPTQDTGLGVHFADLDTAGLAAGEEVVFTMHWATADRWEGTDYRLKVVPG